MAPPKRKAGGAPGSTSSGRVTPKGTRPGQPKGARVERVKATELGLGDGLEPKHAREASRRYTPPVPKELRESPRWVPVLMFALLICGGLMIVVNYIGGGISNWLLIGGLAAILAGILVATQYR